MPSSSRAARRLAGCLVGAAVALAAPAWSAVCDAWPGEPDPLPALTDPDPLRAEWAQLRVRELRGVARRFEESGDARAQQLWRHLLCIDPAHDEAMASMLRSTGVRLHRPELRDAPFDTRRVDDPWRSLGAPIGLRTPGGQGEPAGELDPLFVAVRELGEDVRRARFERALSGAESLRTALASAPRGSARVSLLAETEVLAATAELALGREQDAVASLRRALTVYPELELDPATTSPKVVRALEAARQSADGGRSR